MNKLDELNHAVQFNTEEISQIETELSHINEEKFTSVMIAAIWLENGLDWLSFIKKI